jgi:hypothetical protein
MKVAVEIGDSIVNYYEIFDKLEGVNSLKESVLSKCLEQSTQSKLPVLSAHCAIMLAGMRSVGLLTQVDTGAAALSEANGTDFSSFESVGDYIGHVRRCLTEDKGSKDDVVPDISAAEPNAREALYDHVNGLLLNVDRLSNRRWKTSDIWALLSVCHLGLTQITDLFAAGTYDSLSNLLINKPTMTVGVNMNQGNTNAATKSLISGISPLDQIQLTCEHALASVDHWQRLGNNYMALVQCRRSFNCLHIELSRLASSCGGGRDSSDAISVQLLEDVVVLGIKMCKLMVEQSAPLADSFSVRHVIVSNLAGMDVDDSPTSAGPRPEYSSANAEKSCNSALALVQSLVSLNTSSQDCDGSLPVSALAAALLAACKLEVSARLATLQKDYSRGLRLANRLVDCVKHASSGNCLAAHRGISLQSELEVEARLVLASVLSHTNTDEALRIVNDAVLGYGTNGNKVVVYSGVMGTKDLGCAVNTATALPHVSVCSLLRLHQTEKVRRHQTDCVSQSTEPSICRYGLEVLVYWQKFQLRECEQKKRSEKSNSRAELENHCGLLGVESLQPM